MGVPIGCLYKRANVVNLADINKEKTFILLHSFLDVLVSDSLV